jgi:hypothetical protein
LWGKGERNARSALAFAAAEIHATQSVARRGFLESYPLALYQALNYY